MAYGIVEVHRLPNIKGVHCILLRPHQDLSPIRMPRQKQPGITNFTISQLRAFASARRTARNSHIPQPHSSIVSRASQHILRRRTKRNLLHHRSTATRAPSKATIVSVPNLSTTLHIRPFWVPDSNVCRCACRYERSRGRPRQCANIGDELRWPR